MHLRHPFYKFAFRFDVERLAAEMFAIPEEAWRRHPLDYSGNSYLPLIATNADVDSSDFESPMLPTEHLRRSSYLQQVLAQFRTLLGRARYMRLEPGHGVPPHVDMQYYWRSHSRVHIPVVTDPAVRFHCGGESVHMAAGEAWTFDNWREHQVVNETGVRRVHLTFDTYGSTEFWELAKPLGREERAQTVPFRPGAVPKLMFETYDGDPVMPPGELELELSRLLADAAAVPGNDPNALAHVRATTDSLIKEWRVLWHLHGPTDEGMTGFAALANWAVGTAAALPPTLRLASNGSALAPVLKATFNALLKPSAIARLREGTRAAAAH